MQNHNSKPTLKLLAQYMSQAVEAYMAVRAGVAARYAGLEYNPLRYHSLVEKLIEMTGYSKRDIENYVEALYNESSTNKDLINIQALSHNHVFQEWFAQAAVPEVLNDTLEAVAGEILTTFNNVRLYKSLEVVHAYVTAKSAVTIDDNMNEINKRAATGLNKEDCQYFAIRLAKQFGLVNCDAVMNNIQVIFNVLSKHVDKKGQINFETQNELLNNSSFMNWLKERLSKVLEVSNLQGSEDDGSKKAAKSFAEKIKSEKVESNLHR